jgi:hypothetical protein
VSISKFEKNMNIISALPNEPNDVGGLSANELKRKFDEGGIAVQQYINEELVPFLDDLSVIAEVGAHVILDKDGKEMPQRGSMKFNGTVTDDIKATIVSFTADDVGARANDWMPTAIDVGAVRHLHYNLPAGTSLSFTFTDDTFLLAGGRGWTLASYVAFVFSGYASGGVRQSITPFYGGDKILLGLNKEGAGHGFTVKNNGASAFTFSILLVQGHEPTVEATEANAVSLVAYSGTPDGAAPVSHVGDRSNPHAVTAPQIGAAPATESETHPGCYYRMVGGVQEWLNPPMAGGVEYRTTERYLGEPVYACLFDAGWVAATTKSVEHGLAVKVSIDIKLLNQNEGLTTSGGVHSLSFNSTTIHWDADWAMGGAKFLLKYTK